MDDEARRTEDEADYLHSKRAHQERKAKNQKMLSPPGGAIKREQLLEVHNP